MPRCWRCDSTSLRYHRAAVDTAKGPVPSMCHLYLAGLEYRPTAWAIGYYKICRLPPFRQPPTTFISRAPTDRSYYVLQTLGSYYILPAPNPAPLLHETRHGCPWFHRGSTRDFQKCFTSLPARPSPLTSHHPQTAIDCLFERATQSHDMTTSVPTSIHYIRWIALRCA